MKLANLRLAGLGLLATSTWAQPAATAPEPRVWETEAFVAVVAGTSTLHAWSVESRRATGRILLTAASARGTLRIPAKSLDGGPAGLNEKMYAALKAEQHAEIVFEAGGTPRPARVTEAPAATAWEVRGRLTLAGGSRDLVLACRVVTADAKNLILETELPLRMTDFGIKPPSFLGLVRTGDEVKVRVRWTLRPARADPAG